MLVRILLNVFFIGLAIFAGYLLMESIRQPVDFKSALEKRELVVQDRLEEISKLQQIYKGLKGDTTYADSFDSMAITFMTDSFIVEIVKGDPYDTTKVADTSYVVIPARDSIMGYIAVKGFVDANEYAPIRQRYDALIIQNPENIADNPAYQDYIAYADNNIKKYFDHIRIVPFSKNNEEFLIESNEVDLEGRRAFGRTVPTFQVSCLVNTYMQEYPMDKYGMYDPDYSTTDVVRVGDLYKPTTAGNW